MKEKTAIKPTRQEDYPEWYQQIIKAADLAEAAPVRGCMIIKPSGYAIWENIQKILDQMIKETGHENACFPLLIPMSFLQKEAAHVAGFAKECAVVTHHRLEEGKDGQLVPAGKLEEPYVIRPTSETIIAHSYAKWIQSYRDLPVKINQWANIMRWEMRTRLFLRTSEFLWQEGHTAHASREEAEEETLLILKVYEDLLQNDLAIPVIKGKKTPCERFPGAIETYTIESMMQDGKALQAGTSHFLGQNFAKASEIEYLDKEGKKQFVWTTSWGVTTRLIGALIMTHSDDNGLILPPKIAPYQVSILPIYRKDSEKEEILAECQKIKKALTQTIYAKQAVRAKIDDRDLRGGEKFWSHVKKGVPIIIELGPRDLAKKQLCITVRIKHLKEKKFIPTDDFLESVTETLDNIQTSLYKKAEERLYKNIHSVSSLDELDKLFKAKSNSPFVLCYWDDQAMEHELVKRHKLSPRCVPWNEEKISANEDKGPCLFTGKENSPRVVLAKSY